MFYRKPIENAKKTMAKLTSENCQWRSWFLIDLQTASEISSGWMFFSFANFITNCGFFLTCLDSIVYDNVLWQRDNFKDEVEKLFLNPNFGGQDPKAEGRGKPRPGLE